MKNARGSDRQIAKDVGCSQPTVTRRKVALEVNAGIRFQCIPDFSKLGLSIAGLIDVTYCVEEQRALILNSPNVLMALESINHVSMFAVFKDFQDYTVFLQSLKQLNINISGVKLFDSATGFLKPFETRNLLNGGQ
jgi:hypothetical protein